MQLQKYHLLSKKIMHPGTPTCQSPLIAFCSPCLLQFCFAQESSVCFLLLPMLNATDRDIYNLLLNIQGKTVIAIMTNRTSRSWTQSGSSTYASVKRRDGWEHSRRIVTACQLPSPPVEVPGAWFCPLMLSFYPALLRRKLLTSIFMAQKLTWVMTRNEK